MTFRELSQKVIIRFAELSIIYGLKFLRKELKESKEVNGVSMDYVYTGPWHVD